MIYFVYHIQNYRKRWFELKGGPRYGGGYTLVYYRDGKSSSVKGTINLETCTDIRPVSIACRLRALLIIFCHQNTKYRTYGFDLLTGDEKIVYPLGTETQSEMEEWLTILGKALGLIEENEPSMHSVTIAYHMWC